MKAWLIAYGAALLTLTVLDGAWLGWVARDFYQREMAAVAADSFRKLPAALFYVAYPAGVAALVLHPLPDSLAQAAFRAALVGLVAYGTYDLTNLATLKSWSASLALTDMAWGTLLSAAMGGAAFLAFTAFKPTAA